MTSPRPKTTVTGAALLSLGLAGTAVRFVLFPLDLGLSQVARAAIPGVLMALVVVGLQMVRAGRRTEERASGLTLGLAAVGGAGLAVAIGLVLAPQGAASRAVAQATGGELPLHERALPGLHVSLPEWAPVHSMTGDPRDGVLELADPGGLERSIELKWSVAEPMPQDMLVGLFSRDGLGVVSTEPFRVAGTDVFIAYFETSGATKRVAVTQWACPDDPRTFVLVSFLTLDREPLLRLHRQILGSVRCGPPVDANALAPTLPVLDGDDLKRQPTPTGVLYELPSGAGFVFTAGARQPGMVAAFDDDATLRRQVVQGFGMQPGAEAFMGEPVRSGDPARSVWRGHVTDPETSDRFEVLMVAFACTEPAQSFIGVYLPATGEVPNEATAQRLASARCPT